MRPLRILTWHIHGNYLYYLTHTPHEFYLPHKPGSAPGYGGCTPNFPWGDNVHQLPAEEISGLEFDCILFQSRQNYLEDQYEILSEAQRRLPRLYLEHDPPREHPTDTRHPVDDPEILLVHCTAFNDLMWDSGRTPTTVIDHGVVVAGRAAYTGELAKGLTVINGLHSRGRRLGADIFERARKQIPLDLVGMQATEMGGLGEVPYFQLADFEARYRFFFNPIRYTSLGLAVCEAMMVGLPIVGLATTELVTVIENDVSGYISTDVSELIERMQTLLDDPALARRLGEGARRVALERFNIERFGRDWSAAFAQVTGISAR